jgi:hypothetical protein
VSRRRSVPNDGDRGATLDSIRGDLKAARANARAVAALTENPGCARRRVIDAARVPAHELARQLGHPVTRGQSPFAIGSGVRFEKRLKEDSDYTSLAEVLRPFVDLPKTGLRVVDLGKVPGMRVGQEWLDTRAKRTDDVLGAISRGDAEAPHLVDHPVLVFDVAGAPVYLEPDALALRVGTQLQLVEIKSYAIIDGQADPAKVSSTGGQSAVYLLALRASLARLGFDPNILRWSVILVAPKNFGRSPVAHEVPLRKKAMALERVLRNVPGTDHILARLPSQFSLDVTKLSKPGSPPGQKRADLDAAVRKLPMRFVPECLATCDLSRCCRAHAIADDSPERLGRAARDAVAGVKTLSDVLRLATSGAAPHEAHLSDIAEALRDAHRALERGRATAPRQCGLKPTRERRS